LNAIEALEQDLRDCGVESQQTRAIGARYARALGSGAFVDWIELYVGVFATLSRGAHKARPSKAEAVERVLLLVNDDLGSQLFDAGARTQLACALRSASTYPYAYASAVAADAFRACARRRAQPARSR
jgi:hypothetical protein